MKVRIFVAYTLLFLLPTVFVFVLSVGKADAQLAGGDNASDISSRNVTGAPPMAPGNPNMSTVTATDNNDGVSPSLSIPLNSMRPASGEETALPPTYNHGKASKSQQ